MNEFEIEIKKRNITRLCHFTKSSNLPFILGDGKFEKNGILSTDYIKKSDYLEELDKKRLDGCTDYVCCSIQRPNSKYMYIRKKASEDDLFHQWAILYIDPSVIISKCKFSLVNAATARGKNIKSEVSAFREMFADPIVYMKNGEIKKKNRPSDIPLNFTTDEQAEVLIKDRVPKEKIIGVAFPKETYDVEKLRLSFCIKNLDIPILRCEN